MKGKVLMRPWWQAKPVTLLIYKPDASYINSWRLFRCVTLNSVDFAPRTKSVAAPSGAVQQH